MDRKEFQIEIVSRERAVYIVEAADAESARRIAIERWQRSEPSDLAGFDWSEVETARVAETPDLLRQIQDDELLLRFIRERERALGPADNAFFAPSGGDAASALQLAIDLRWEVPDSPEGPKADAVRAARALERLCANKKLVCFQRPRSRRGERGELRLYCTPEYLEQLTQALSGVPASAR